MKEGATDEEIIMPEAGTAREISSHDYPLFPIWIPQLNPLLKPRISKH